MKPVASPHRPLVIITMRPYLTLVMEHPPGQGQVDGAIQLDGVNDYLAIQDLFYNQVGQIPQVTVSAWIKTFKSSEGIVMSFDRSEYWRLSVGGSNNNGKIMFATATSSVADLYGQTVVSDGSWHMITAFAFEWHGHS